MKKLFFFAAIASVAFASCVKNDPAPSVTEQHEITFAAPVVATTTKAQVELLKKYPIDETFGVFALYYAEKFTGYSANAVYMTDVEATRGAYAGTDGAWSTAGYYWPKNGGKLTFAAYSPYDQINVKASHDDSGIHFDDYVVTTAANVDLMFSNRAYNKAETDQDTNTDNYYGVELVFNHALSAVKFMVNTTSQLATDGYEFVIQKIELLNINNTGDFDQKLTAYVAGTNETPSTPTADVADWTVTDDEEKYIAFENATGITVNSTTAVSTIAADAINKYANLILMPQQLSALPNAAQIKVTYKYRHNNMATGVYVEDNVVTTNLSVAGCETWLRGKRYVYTLTMDLDKIYFAPRIEDWADAPVAGPTIND